MLMLSFLFGAMVLFYLYCKRKYNYWTERGVPQNNPLWVLGSEWQSFLPVEHISDTFQRLYDEFPEAKYNGFYNFWKPRLIVKDPELIKDITVKDFVHFVDRTQFIDPEHEEFWGKNLFALEGQKWRESRLVLSPSFTGSKMRAMFVLVTDCCKNFIDFFLEKDQKTVEINVNDSVTRFTNDAIASTAFGLETDSLTNPENDFYMIGQETLKLTTFKILNLLVYQIVPSLYRALGMQFFTLKSRQFYKNLVSEIIKFRENKGIVRPDVIHLLTESRRAMEANGKKNLTITDDDIVSHAFLFFLGGLDTVSSVLNNLLCEVALHQDVQDRLRTEILETKVLHNGEVPYDVLMQMKYMDMVVSETMRKWSPMSQILRKCTKPYVLPPALPGGKPLPIVEGTTLIIPTFNIQRDPKLFPEPLKFDPERFSDENKGDIDPYAYLPFGTGPRNCIGNRFALMEVKALTLFVLSTFRVVATENTVVPYKLSPTSFSPRPEKKFVLGLQKLKT